MQQHWRISLLHNHILDAVIFSHTLYNAFVIAVCNFTSWNNHYERNHENTTDMKQCDKFSTEWQALQYISSISKKGI